jgi:hypothetical protein
MRTHRPLALLQIVSRRSHKSSASCTLHRAARARSCNNRVQSTAQLPCFSLLSGFCRRTNSPRQRKEREELRTRVRARTSLGLQLYLHIELAFACISLYRTRRFLSLSGAADWLDARAASPKPDQKLRVFIPFGGFRSEAWPYGGIVCSKLNISDYGASQTDPEHVTTKARRRHT